MWSAALWTAGMKSPPSRRVYEYAINQFIAWYCSEPRLAFNRIVVVIVHDFVPLSVESLNRIRDPPGLTQNNYVGSPNDATGCAKNHVCEGFIM